MRRRIVLLDDYLTLWSDRRFDWATNCCHFTAGWVRMIENVDPLAMAKLAGDFGSPLAAGRMLQVFGGDLRSAVTQALARAEQLPSLAQVGDVVLLPGTLYGTLGICNGRDVAVLTTEGGTTFRNMSEAITSWPVGR